MVWIKVYPQQKWLFGSFFPYIPPTTQGGKTSRRASTVASKLIEHDCGIVCLLFMCVIVGPPGRPAKGLKWHPA